jgi:predicted TIM-barrel fold metal-dependent hydrolase
MPLMTQRFDIFDCHHHVGDVKALVAGAFPHEELSTADALGYEMNERVAIMDRDGCHQAAVIPSHAYERPNGQADTRTVNNAIAAYRDAWPDRFPVAIGVVEPLHGAVSLDELDRCRNELGLAGISFHTRFQGASMDNHWIARYIERMGELGLVPVLHAFVEAVDEAMWKIGDLARAFPDVAMLVLDPFSTFDGTKEASHLAELCPNLLFDTSLSHTFDYIEVFAGRFGADRVVFGTDLYSPPFGRRISHLALEIAESALPDAAKTAILGGNARRLFGVDNPQLLISS